MRSITDGKDHNVEKIMADLTNSDFVRENKPKQQTGRHRPSASALEEPVIPQLGQSIDDSLRLNAKAKTEQPATGAGKHHKPSAYEVLSQSNLPSLEESMRQALSGKKD
jgi:hypothetical protein